MTDPTSFAVPTLKVMRLQKPDLDTPTAGTLNSNTCLLGTALCLPNSFGVIHVGETFTAYLGALNTHQTLNVRQLTVTAQLQTPSQRWQLASQLDPGNATGGVEVAPNAGVDCIVSHHLEEAGQHILRVEVSYLNQGTVQSLRKFYRFQVSQPLQLLSNVVRLSDQCCFVTITLEHDRDRPSMTISSLELEPATGMTATPVKKRQPTTVINGVTSTATTTTTTTTTGVQLYDSSGRLELGDTRNYLFQVTATVTEHGSTKGIAAGDELGRAVVTWRKACGEMGRMASTSILCPALTNVLVPDPRNTEPVWSPDFVVHTKGGSCLSVDVASMAASRAANPVAYRNSNNNPHALDILLPITVEPIQPPETAQLGTPFAVTFLLVNHSDHYRTLQLQFPSDQMKGLIVCGPSFVNLQEELAGGGGSIRIEVRFMAITAGLLKLQGCHVVDLATGQSIPQPPLFHMFVPASPPDE
ncbi:DUF974 domain containing protein [Nitzschia inconspicua]|uniref:DUF974 domain containing protein n=1 Tax=Nitzschia inconspicua TaxID=303405 RepID=A0A9K3LJ36_9STRA|nr:DUF974 domain containing protein [Nitzschia inconspicua]